MDESLGALLFPAAGEAGNKCPICLRGTAQWFVKPDAADVPCPRCGTYSISGTAQATAEALSERNRTLLSGYCRDALLGGKPANLSDDTLQASASWPLPSLTERAMRMLRWAITYIASQDNTGRELVWPGMPAFIGASYSRDVVAAHQVAAVLQELGYLELPDDKHKRSPLLSDRAWRVTARGRLAAEELETQSQASAIGFGAMWFADSMRPAWDEGIAPAIRDAGFDPIRVDQVEHVGKIDDEIMLQIRKARFVVADFSGHRTGVYFEAGYALGLGLPVIWTCRKEDMAQLHFDIRQYNCIDWNDHADLRKRLAFRIEQAVGVGPRRSA